MAFRVVTLRLPGLLRIGAAALAVILAGILLFLTLGSGGKRVSSEAAVYQPGVYSASVAFGAQTVSVEIIMTSTGIQSVSYEIPEDVSSVYPLIRAASAMIEKQVESGGDPSAIQPDSASQDTAAYLLRAIRTACSKAILPSGT